MKDRPIIFSASMVLAILAGTKSQTRRVVRKPKCYSAKAWASAVPHNEGDGGVGVFGSDPYLRVDYDEETEYGGKRIRCPYGVVGDALWVKETCTYVRGNGVRRWYRADGEQPKGSAGQPVAWEPFERRWVPSIFMPRWASRITLAITGVRVERLQDISEEDARAEGIAGAQVPTFFADGEEFATARGAYAFLWDGINGERASWESNPWVWVLSFRRVESKEEAAE